MTVWLSFLACPHAPVSPETPQGEPGRIPTALEVLADAPERCKEGLEVEDPAALAAAIHANYERCGPGHALLAAEALVHFHEGDGMGALQLALREIQEPAPSQVAMDMALGMLGSAPPEVRRLGVALGRDQEHPIHVPSIQSEYQWVGVVGCAEGSPSDVGQALIMTDKVRLDMLSFECGDEKGEVYFDFSADPVEQELEKALGR